MLFNNEGECNTCDTGIAVGSGGTSSAVTNGSPLIYPNVNIYVKSCPTNYTYIPVSPYCKLTSNLTPSFRMCGKTKETAANSCSDILINCDTIEFSATYYDNKL
jgi:hypothetical protein